MVSPGKSMNKFIFNKQAQQRTTS